MMLAFLEITLDFFVLSGIIAAAIAVGFMLRSIKLTRVQQQIGKLEKEMLNSHAEILRLQKELSDKNVNQSQAPVFSIRNTSELSKETSPDPTSNKKALPGMGKPKL
jgi:hypothetical protein